MYDIAIIGGGIAGISAAKEISQRCNANVVLVEKSTELGSLPSSAFIFSDTIEKFGLQHAVIRYYRRIGLYSYLGSRVIFNLEKPEIAVLDYRKACREIFSKSRKENVEIFDRTCVTKLTRINDNVRIDLEGVRKGSIVCNLLIDASGAAFFSSKYIGFKIPAFYSHPYGYGFANCQIPEDSLDELAFFVGKSIGSGGGWFYPLDSNSCRFGIAEITNTHSFPAEKLKRHYTFAKKKMRPFCDMVSGAIPTEVERGTIPAEPMKELVTNNIMRTGDAAGHATPHMMEGVRPCIESGTLCGMVAAEAYEKHDFREIFLSRYERLWQQKNKYLYLYLLSRAQVTFNFDDLRTEESIHRQACRKVEPASYLKGVRGWFMFPNSLVTLQPTKEYLEVLLRFLYNNARWVVQ